MPLITHVKELCQRLAPHGWGELFSHHGLDILANDLQDELRKVLPIDRTRPGFEDFSRAGACGIEPYRPSLSLLYHALASPAVTQMGAGKMLTAYPTPDELECVLNYVFGCIPPSLDELYAAAGEQSELAIVTFASEYRLRNATAHRQHADLCFSRAGIARVGTAAPHYSPEHRRYVSSCATDMKAIHAIPVRYSAYIAMRRKGDMASSRPMNYLPGDNQHDFWVPLHKLFEGDECLQGQTVDLRFDVYHVNAKMRYIHTQFSNTGWGEPEISQPPFVRTEGLCESVSDAKKGGVQINPTERAALVERADFQGHPLTIIAPSRSADGMTHLRHQRLESGAFYDLNTSPDLEQRLESGGHHAFQYQDNTADGWVKASSLALAPLLGTQAAYSVIAPPDFFPLTGQARLNAWVAEAPDGLPAAPPGADYLRYIWHAKNVPLSDVRFSANITLPGGLFAVKDKTVFTVVNQEWLQQEPAQGGEDIDVPSVLPDHAAGTFGPGWEVGGDFVSDGQNGKVNIICGYRLGTPFTEDIRICAALGSFWPTVSPDSARTFEPRKNQTHIPMLDSEIGIGDATSWDGTKGPSIIEEGAVRLAEYTAYSYTDYTANALKNDMLVSLTATLTSTQYQQRILALRAIYSALGCGEVNLEDEKRQTEWAILSFDAIVRPHRVLAQAEQQASLSLEGTLFYAHLYKHGTTLTPAADFTKRHVEILEEYFFFTGNNGVLRKAASGAWEAVR